jgi:hypothetical protein
MWLLLSLLAASRGVHADIMLDTDINGASLPTARPLLPLLTIGDCSNFSSLWVSRSGKTAGEYIHLTFSSTDDEKCDVVATNPTARWSPLMGKIFGDTLHLLGLVGQLREHGKAIEWNDHEHTIWRVMEAPPLQAGLDEARSMLQFAIETEQSVIQPFLSALYSIHPGTNANASSILHGLVVEEMLHMTTASNVLNAIGGHPSMNTSSFVPVYPVMLPFVNMSLSLAPFTHEQMDVFRRVEEPAWGPDNEYRLNTVGAYYFRIGMLLHAIVKAYGEKAVYSGDPALQVSTSSSRGTVQRVQGHVDAMSILVGVYTQGEGNKNTLFETSPYSGESELPHYYRFNEVMKNRCYDVSNETVHLEDPTGSALGVDYTAVYAFKVNPKAADFSNYTDIYRQMLEFNSCYTHVLAGLHDVFNGNPDGFGQQLDNMMLVGELAKKLMAIPHPQVPGMAVGAPWEWLDIDSDTAVPCPGLPSTIVV